MESAYIYPRWKKEYEIKITDCVLGVKNRDSSTLSKKKNNNNTDFFLVRELLFFLFVCFCFCFFSYPTSLLIHFFVEI